jgi:hypothetical protein
VISAINLHTYLGTVRGNAIAGHAGVLIQTNPGLYQRPNKSAYPHGLLKELKRNKNIQVGESNFL